MPIQGSASSTPEKSLASSLRRGLPLVLCKVALTILCLTVFIFCLWAFLAVWFFNPWPAWIRMLGAILWALVAPVVFFLLPRLWALAGLMGTVLIVWLLWSLTEPSNQRTWTADQERLPITRFEGETVHIQNFRHVKYSSPDESEVGWYEKRYDLGAIQRMDFVVARFSLWRGLAHTLLTFGFANGQCVAISVESRKEHGESYSPLKGLFKQFEIMYVIGDERDLIGVRAKIRKNPVYVFPIKATPEQVRALFVVMLQRANQLAKQPEFYNTLANNCTTNIVRHLEQLAKQNLPFDLRVLFPGYADDLAKELGLIDFNGTLEEARKRFRINNRSDFGGKNGPTWSREIRQFKGK